MLVDTKFFYISLLIFLSCLLIVISYNKKDTNNTDFVSTKLARCFVIPQNGSNLDGHIKFKQTKFSDELYYELEIFDDKISGISFYEKQMNCENYNCINDIGKELFKFPINELTSKDQKIIFNGSIDIEDTKSKYGLDLSLFNSDIYNYSCIVNKKLELNSESNSDVDNTKTTESFENKIVKNSSLGYGKVQIYELETSFMFGLYVVLSHFFMCLFYLYKFGV